MADNLGNDPGTRLINLFLRISKKLLAKSSLLFAALAIIFLLVVGILVALSDLLRNLAV